MSDDRDKLLGIMNNLESDYRSGKISAEKYSYFRSKYEDKLNSIDARDATKRIRSMQGKPSTDTRKRSKKPTKNKRKQEQDLVQKYIINPKKSDATYNKKKKSAMDSGTFKLLLLLILVVGFTAGIAYGIFNFDFGTISQADTVAVVDDTAFPEFKNDVKVNTTTDYGNYTNYDNDDDDDKDNIETTADNSNSQNSDSSSSSNSNNQGQSSDSGGGSQSSDSGGGSQESGNGGNSN